MVEDEICVTQLVVRSNAAESRHMKKFFARNILKIKGVCTPQARNQDFMWGGANEAKVDQTTEIYFLLSNCL